jgi:hypothetical protein
MSTVEFATPPIPPAPTRGVRRRVPLDGKRIIIAATIIAALVTIGLLAFGPPGVDRAAHEYYTAQFAANGWDLWNNYWYAGRYQLLNYSILFYPAASLAGLDTMVVVSVATAAAAFAAVARRVTNRDALIPAVVFALTWPAVVIAGQYPFALGTALALWCVVAAAARRYSVAVVLAAGTMLSSPLAFLLLVVVLGGIITSVRPSMRPWPVRLAVAAMLVLLTVELALLRVFPVTGTFPFPVADLAALELLCVVGFAVAARHRAMRGMFAAYGVVALIVYAIPGSVGGNFERIAEYFSVALLLLAFRTRGVRLGRVGWLVLGVAVVLQAAPIIRNAQGAFRERADQPAFWAGAISFLGAHRDPNYRVEAVATWGHWESFHLARAGFALTRGWFRQDDFPQNAMLYDGNLDPASYRDWLRSLGVRYVVVPNDELDFSTVKEAQILRGPGNGGLRFVFGDTHTAIYELPDPTPLLTMVGGPPPPPGSGAAAVTAMTTTSLSLSLPGPGEYQLRVRYTPFWRTSDPAAVCVAPSGVPGLTRIVTSRGGPVNLVFDLSIAGSTSQALGIQPPICAAPPANVFFARP